MKPARLNVIIKSDLERWKKFMTNAGISAD